MLMVHSGFVHYIVLGYHTLFFSTFSDDMCTCMKKEIVQSVLYVRQITVQILIKMLLYGLSYKV